MEPRLSYALVGLFVLALGSAAIFASLWLAGIGPVGEMRTYLVYLEESVAGLTLESAVKYQGVDVGQVREIGLDPDNPSRVRLLIDVRREIPVNQDTVASLATQGMTGLVYYIELRGGGPDSPSLETVPGAAYPAIASEPSLAARLQREGFALLNDVRDVTSALHATLADIRALLGEENRKAIAATLQDAASTANRLSHASAVLEDYLERLDPVLGDLARTAGTLPDLAEHADGTLDTVDAAAGEVRRLARDLGRLLADVSPGLTALTRDGLPQVDPLMRGLRALIARLERLAADLEQDPDLLVRGRARRPGPGER